MTDDDLSLRIRRIYAAIDAAVETDLRRVPPTVTRTETVISVAQNFRGGLSPEAISNLAYQVIHNIANLRDNLRKWAEANAKNPARVRATFDSSLPLRVLQDLSNADKHGYPLTRPSNSGLDPLLTEVDRVMRLKPAPGGGVFAVIDLGGMRAEGGGSAKVVVTGKVTAKDGSAIGDLYELELKAVEAWESLLAEYGVPIN